MSDLHARHVRKGVAMHTRLLREMHRNIESTSEFAKLSEVDSNVYTYLALKMTYQKSELRTINNYPIYVGIYKNA
jgi:hypothetical protein